MPMSQCVHSVAAVTGMNDPGEQSSHSAAPGAGAALPATQLEQASSAMDEPVLGLAVPGGQERQSSMPSPLPNAWVRGVHTHA